eukprot:1241024-Prymnesium_polylepis.2
MMLCFVSDRSFGAAPGSARPACGLRRPRGCLDRGFVLQAIPSLTVGVQALTRSEPMRGLGDTTWTAGLARGQNSTCSEQGGLCDDDVWSGCRVILCDDDVWR